MPSAKRTYSCKRCGGAVVVEDARVETTADAEPVCPECQVASPAGSRFCEECGASLGEPTARRRHTPASRRARAEATQELRRVRNALGALQLGFRAGGVIALLFAVLFATWWYRLGTHGWGTSARLHTLITTIVWVLEATLLLVGAVYVRRAPFVLALVLASLATVGTASLLAVLDWGSTATAWKALAILCVLFTTGLWLLIPATLKLGRLREESPHLFATRKQSGARRRSLAGAPSKEGSTGMSGVTRLER